jgi:hypothetical protein
VDEPDRLTRARERAAQAKARELAAHRRAEELHEQAAETLERLGHHDLAHAVRQRAQRSRELHAEALREQAAALRTHAEALRTHVEALREHAEAGERATGHDGE